MARFVKNVFITCADDEGLRLIASTAPRDVYKALGDAQYAALLYEKIISDMTGRIWMYRKKNDTAAAQFIFNVPCVLDLAQENTGDQSYIPPECKE